MNANWGATFSTGAGSILHAWARDVFVDESGAVRAYAPMISYPTVGSEINKNLESATAVLSLDSGLLINNNPDVVGVWLYRPAAVPLPGVLALLGIGAAALVGARRWRR